MYVCMYVYIYIYIYIYVYARSLARSLSLSLPLRIPVSSAVGGLDMLQRGRTTRSPLRICAAVEHYPRDPYPEIRENADTGDSVFHMFFL